MIKTTLQIEGMSCGMCESHINEVIRKNFKVEKVTSSHKKNQAEIISKDALDEDKLKEAIGATGYQVLSVSREEYVKKGFFSFGK